MKRLLAMSLGQLVTNYGSQHSTLQLEEQLLDVMIYIYYDIYLPHILNEAMQTTSQKGMESIAMLQLAKL